MQIKIITALLIIVLSLNEIENSVSESSIEEKSTAKSMSENEINVSDVVSTEAATATPAKQVQTEVKPNVPKFFDTQHKQIKTPSPLDIDPYFKKQTDDIEMRMKQPRMNRLPLKHFADNERMYERKRMDMRRVSKPRMGATQHHPDIGTDNGEPWPYGPGFGKDDRDRMRKQLDHRLPAKKLNAQEHPDIGTDNGEPWPQGPGKFVKSKEFKPMTKQKINRVSQDDLTKNLSGPSRLPDEFINKVVKKGEN